MLYSFDVETHLSQPGLAAPPLVCASWASDPQNAELAVDKTRVVEFFRWLVRNQHVGGANFVYDLAVMAAHDPSLVDDIFQCLEDGRAFSTDLLEGLHDNALGTMYREGAREFNLYSLAMLENRHLGIDRTEQKKNGWRRRYALLDGKPLSAWPPEAIQYPRDDAIGTWRVLEKQLVDDRKNLDCIKQEMQASWFLKLSSVWGLRTDPLMVPRVVAEIEEKHIANRKHFEEVGFVKVRKARGGKEPETPDFWQQYSDGIEVGMKYSADKKALKAAVMKAYHDDPPLTDKGDISTDKDTLLESGNPELERYGEEGANEKLRSTYCKILLQGTVTPINPGTNSLVSTARSSYFEPNLQNLPREGWVRYCFVPREGWVYVSVDFGGVELCTLSQCCLWMFGKSAMADALNNGQDLHIRLAARFAGVTYEEAMAAYKAGDQAMVGLRQVMKPVNFGLGGLMGPPRLVLTARKDGIRFCELTGVSTDCGQNEKALSFGNGNRRRKIPPTCVECLKFAVTARRTWYEVYPEMYDYHEVAKEIADGGKHGDALVSLSRGKMLRLESNPGAVSNHFFQNLAAVGAKDAGWELAKESYTDRQSVLFNNFRTVVFVHDEFMAEVREEVLHECASRQQELMVSTMQQKHVPDVLIKAEPAAQRRWFKGAKQVLDRNGRLKPYWPKDWAWEPDQAAVRKDLAA